MLNHTVFHDTLISTIMTQGYALVKGGWPYNFDFAKAKVKQVHGEKFAINEYVFNEGCRILAFMEHDAGPEPVYIFINDNIDTWPEQTALDRKIREGRLEFYKLVTEGKIS